MRSLRLRTPDDFAEYMADPSDEVVAFATSVGADPHRLHRFWQAPRKAQQARYERVLLATLALARKGGYEAVQMRDVASESGVSLASIYTYFGSRDYLAYRVAIIWAALMTSQAATASIAATDGDSRERTLSEFVTRAKATWGAEPKMLAFWVHSTMTDDPGVVAAQRDIRWSYWLDKTPLASSTSHDTQALVELLQDVFYARAVRWVFGQQDLDDVLESGDEIKRRLLSPSGDD